MTALAYSHTPQAPPPRGALLSLVKRRMPRDLRTAYVLDAFVNECLTLDERDGRQLEKHFGWSPEASVMLGLRSVPGPVSALVLASELRRIVGDSDEWPAGFYTDPETGALKLDAPRYGLLVAVWRKWPVGLQHYRSAADPRPRWLSSAAHETGTAASASVHCVGTAEDERVVMVSHTLEAQAVAIRHKVAAVGFNGAAAGNVPAQLFEAFPRLRGVVMAMADPPRRLEGELRAAGLGVSNWGGGSLI